MERILENWKTQLRKGYLDLCILLIIFRERRVYGFDLIEKLKNLGLPLKEGTVYPLLTRMSVEGWLESEWVLEGAKGHPRKFYSLSPKGLSVKDQMASEFSEQIQIFEHLVQKNKNIEGI